MKSAIRTQAINLFSNLHIYGYSKIIKSKLKIKKSIVFVKLK